MSTPAASATKPTLGARIAAAFALVAARPAAAASAEAIAAAEGAQLEAFAAELSTAGVTVSEGQTVSAAIIAARESALGAVNAELATLRATHSTYISALASLKITPKSAKEGEALTSADVTTAINDRIAIGAAESLAKRGLKDFPATVAAPASSASGATNATQMGRAAFFALSPADQLKFVKNKGIITDGPGVN